jgi:UDP-glucose 4-epimerase
VGKLFNIGGTQEISILSLAHRVIELLESASQIAFVPYEQVYAKGFEDMARRVPDTTRIREAIGWQPERSLDDIILDVADSLRK